MPLHCDPLLCGPHPPHCDPPCTAVPLALCPPCCALQAKENLELRMKYSGEPMKFLDNEVDLLSIIRGLAQVCRL
jgi:hypothetical protein